jgi:hypothetical protein
LRSGLQNHGDRLAGMVKNSVSTSFYNSSRQATAGFVPADLHGRGSATARCRCSSAAVVDDHFGTQVKRRTKNAIKTPTTFVTVVAISG